MVEGIGSYRYPVTVQKPKTSATADAYGQIDLNDDANWETHCTRKAEIFEQSGREFRAGDQVRADITHSVVLRFDPNTRLISTKMRVQFVDGTQTRYLNIESVNARGVPQRKSVELLCKEVV